MKSFFGRIIIALFVILFAWIAYHLTGYTRLRFQLNSRVASLRSDGSPVCIADLERQDLSKSEAYGELVELAPKLERLGRIMLPFQQEDEKTSETVGEQHNAVEGFLAEQPGLINRLRKASQHRIGNSWCDFSADSTNFLESTYEQINNYRAAVRVLAADAESQLFLDKSDAAALDAIAILRWSDHVAAEPGLISYLVSIACRSQGYSVAASVLANKKLSDEKREELVRAVSQHNAVAAWSAALASERAIGLTLAGNFGPVSHLPSMIRDRIQYLDLIQEYQSAAAQPWGLHKSSVGMNSVTLTGQVSMAIESAFESFRQSQAQSRALILIDAWQQAKRPTLVDVSQLGVEPDQQMNPFDGAPFRIRAGEGELTFYCVGTNLADDQGQLVDDLDVGFSVTTSIE